MIDSMPTWLGLLVYALATARVTGLLAYDEITRPLRENAVRRLNPARRGHRAVAYLLGGADDDADGCPWCLSVWVAAAVAPLVYFFGDHPGVLVPALALALSQISGMTAAIGRG